MDIRDGKLHIEKEGKVKKLVREVEQISFSGKRAVIQGQDITYITERCVMKLTSEGVVVTRLRLVLSCRPTFSIRPNSLSSSLPN